MLHLHVNGSELQNRKELFLKQQLSSVEGLHVA